MQDRFKFRIIIEKDCKTVNGIYKGQFIYYCNGFIQTKLKTYFFGNNKKLSVLNSQIKAINQSTGLKDKNGILIYEGDIVIEHYYNTKETTIKKVFFDEKVIGFAYTDGIEYNQLSITDGNRLHVIGNIYENAEILEE